MKTIYRKSRITILLLVYFSISLHANVISSLTLINADTDTDIRVLKNKDTIDLSKLPTVNLNIRANTQPATVGSVVFAYDGNPSYRIESVAPYCIEGDNNGDYNAWTPAAGTHTLTVTPYTDASGKGTAGTPFTITFIVIGNVTSPCPGGSQAPTGISGELKQWHKITITFEGVNTTEKTVPNPFTDYRLDVSFTKGSKTYKVPGYYAADGNASETSADCGNRWRVHFSPDETGVWKYQASFRTGANIAASDDPNAGTAVIPLDGVNGTFNIAASDKTGKDLRAKGRLKYTGEHCLQFSGNGEYFLKGGADSPENFLAYNEFDNTLNHGGTNYIKSWSPHTKDWKVGDPVWKGTKGKGIIGAINYLASKQMNVFSFLTMNVNGDGKDVWPWISHTERSRYDCSKLDQWEKVFEHAEKLGFYLHFKTQETENDQLLDGGNVGNERKVYYRELIARFSHHLALNWNLGEENTQTEQQRKDMAAYFASHDPYKHHIVIHTYPGDHSAVYTPLLGNNSNLTGVSIQTGWNNVHTATKKWVNDSKNAGKKWVVCNDEQGSANTGVTADASYTGNQGNYTNTDNHDDIRKSTLWGNLMAGGAGVEYYFGYQTGETDLTLQDFRSRDRMWEYTAYALDFFRNYLSFHRMTNQNNLIGNGSDDNNKYCFAEIGKVYAVFLANGGSTSINLASGNYVVKWFNPRTGGALQDGSVKQLSGGANVSVGNPPSDPTKDWALLIYNENTTGTKDQSTDALSLNIYPNPSTDGNMTIQWQDNDHQIQLEVINLLGERIYSTLTNERIISFNLPSGIYLLKIKAGEEELIRKFIVL